MPCTQEEGESPGLGENGCHCRLSSASSNVLCLDRTTAAIYFPSFSLAGDSPKIGLTLDVQHGPVSRHSPGLLSSPRALPLHWQMSWETPSTSYVVITRASAVQAMCWPLSLSRGGWPSPALQMLTVPWERQQGNGSNPVWSLCQWRRDMMSRGTAEGEPDPASAGGWWWLNQYQLSGGPARGRPARQRD